MENIIIISLITLLLIINYFNQSTIIENIFVTVIGIIFTKYTIIDKITNSLSSNKEKYTAVAGLVFIIGYLLVQGYISYKKMNK